MVWVVLIVLALVAYFIYKTLLRRHISRSLTGSSSTRHALNTTKRVSNNAEEQLPGTPEAIKDPIIDINKDPKKATSNKANKAALSDPLPSPHDGPSLLYADRNNTGNQPAYDNNRNSDHGGIQANDQINKQNRSPANQSTVPKQDHVDTTASDSSGNEFINSATQDHVSGLMDFTAETATLNSDDVGKSANNSEYDQLKTAQHELASDNTVVGTAPATAAVAGIAAIAFQASNSADININSDSDSISSNNDQGRDLELGDSTHNESETPNNDEHDEHDELLDFGDLTVDISEMLKELNLRETDSPRLEINQEEFQQLKTGDPGEVKPEKIENVAGKLRNMLQ